MIMYISVAVLGLIVCGVGLALGIRDGKHKKGR